VVSIAYEMPSLIAETKVAGALRSIEESVKSLFVGITRMELMGISRLAFVQQPGALRA